MYQIRIILWIIICVARLSCCLRSEGSLFKGGEIASRDEHPQNLRLWSNANSDFALPLIKMDRIRDIIASNKKAKSTTTKGTTKGTGTTSRCSTSTTPCTTTLCTTSTETCETEATCCIARTTTCIPSTCPPVTTTKKSKKSSKTTTAKKGSSTGAACDGGSSTTTKKKGKKNNNPARKIMKIFSQEEAEGDVENHPVVANRTSVDLIDQNVTFTQNSLPDAIPQDTVSLVPLRKRKYRNVGDDYYPEYTFLYKIPPDRNKKKYYVESNSYLEMYE